MDKKAVNLVVSGRVQGVGFRYFARQQAVPRGIRGWVKNLSDGSVEIWAEAEKEILEDFVDHIGRGPTFGRVDDMEIRWAEPTGDFTIFDIRF